MRDEEGESKKEGTRSRNGRASLLLRGNIRKKEGREKKEQKK